MLIANLCGNMYSNLIRWLFFLLDFIWSVSHYCVVCEVRWMINLSLTVCKIKALALFHLSLIHSIWSSHAAVLFMWLPTAFNGVFYSITFIIITSHFWKDLKTVQRWVRYRYKGHVKSRSRCRGHVRSANPSRVTLSERSFVIKEWWSVVSRREKALARCTCHQLSRDKD